MSATVAINVGVIINNYKQERWSNNKRDHECYSRDKCKYKYCRINNCK